MRDLLDTFEIYSRYAGEDQEYRQHLETSLTLLKPHSQLITWFDREILPDEDGEGVFDEHLDTADIIIFLISPDFLASNYGSSRKMQRALERQARGEARVLPILVRSCAWTDGLPVPVRITPFGCGAYRRDGYFKTQNVHKLARKSSRMPS